MTNPTLEQRARALLRIYEGELTALDPDLYDAFRSLTFSHTGVEQAIEACAKVAEEHADSCAQARGNAGAFNDRHAVWQAESERLASLTIAAAIRATLPAQSPDDIAYAGAASSPVNVEGLVEASGLVPGPTWHVDADDCWTSEIQVVGGYYVVATIHGGTEAEAIARRDATLIALASLSPDGER